MLSPSAGTKLPSPTFMGSYCSLPPLPAPNQLETRVGALTMLEGESCLHLMLGEFMEGPRLAGEPLHPTRAAVLLTAPI